MAGIAVIYRSRYGHARAYAEWIAAELGADLYEGTKAEKLARYDTLIFGGGLYAGGIGGAGFVREHFDRLREKHLVVFTVGITGTGDPGAFQSSIDRAFTAEMQRHIRFFHLRGGLDYRQLNVLHRSFMGVLRLLLKGKRERTQQEEILIDACGGRVDFRDRASIRPLVDYVRGLQGGAER